MLRKLVATFAVAILAAGMIGCAGEPPQDAPSPGPAASSAPAGTFALTGGEWRVVEIAQAPVVANSTVTISFGADGRVSGNSTCNGFSGPYTNVGGRLSIGPTAGTLRACVEAERMEQETRFLGVLAEVNAYTVTPDSALVLRTADGRTITARRG